MKWLTCICWLSFAAAAFGESYLTEAEALRLSFPHATAVDTRTYTLSREQAKAIEKRSGVKTRPRTYRLSVMKQDSRTVGVFLVDSVIGKHDLIDFSLALGTNGEVLQVEILQYREHYGGQVRNAKWRDQFKGKTAAAPFKLNKDVYNISGATLSCRHVSEGIKRLLVMYEQVVRPDLAAAGRLSPATR